MIWYFMFRTSVATIKGSGAPKISRSSSKRIGRVSRCEYKYAVFTTCLLGVGRPHALRWFLHSLGRLGDSDIRLRREGTALSAKPRYPLHSLASSTEVTFFNTALQGVYRRLAVQLTETFDKHSTACCVSSWWVVGGFVWVSRLQQVVFAISSAQTRRFQLSGCHETRVEPSTLFTHKEIHTEPQMHNLSLSCSDLVRC